MATKGAVEVNSVIQISPEADVLDVFKAKLAIVEEVKGFGVVAYVMFQAGNAYNRLTWDQFEVIGMAVWVKEEQEETE